MDPVVRPLASRPSRAFASLDDLAAALQQTIGCEQRRTDVGQLYTARALQCRTSSGAYLVAMLDMSASVVERVLADRREVQQHAVEPQDAFLVLGDGWVITVGREAAGRQVQQALGGDLVVVSAEAERAARRARSAAYEARLPKPQRPDLAPEDYPARPTDRSHTMLVHVGPPHGADDLAAADIDDAFIEAVESAGLGVGDGDEHGPSGTTFFYSGPDARAMLRAVEPVLAQLAIPPGSYIDLFEGERHLAHVPLEATSG